MCKADRSAVVNLSPPVSSLLCRTSPYNQETISAYYPDAPPVAVEFNPNDELYRMIVGHLCKSAAVNSFTLSVGRAGGDCDDEEDEPKRASCKGLGLGLFPYEFDGSKILALHQTLGDVVGSDCGATLLKNLVLFASHIDVLTSFCDRLLAIADESKPNRFTCYRWHVQHHYWRREDTSVARQLDSVVLPSAVKEKLVSDLDDFVSAGTRSWYQTHGIPYKRSYLLYGSPGAGKTSLIQAIAGRYKRNLAILTPSHPDMNDDGLKAAVQRVPHRSIIVLEDVDSLFSEGRTKSEGNKSALTFSGVLNALDGVGGCAGQIFILTTNHRERLNPALIRNGRVDCHVEFTDAKREQMSDLFKQFYTGAADGLAEDFAKGLDALLGEKEVDGGKRASVSMAALQHYFIQQRKASPEEAAAGFAKVIEEAEAHGKIKKEAEEKEAEEEEKKEAAEEEKTKKGKKGGKAAVEKGEGEEGEGKGEGKGEGEGEAEAEDDEKPKKGSKAKGNMNNMHVHVHVH